MKLTPIYVAGKGGFLKRGNLEKIKSQINKFKQSTCGETIVIFCVDTDNITVNMNDKIFFDNIVNFTTSKGFECVWFCRCIEEVYIGKQVSDEDKVKCAKRFRSNTAIRNVNMYSLSSDIPRLKYSNILLVLDKYLVRKNNEKCEP